jgi:pilus assembly protein CpaE
MPEKILLVDDDIDTLRLVGMMLESKGYEIIAAEQGQKAIGLAKSESPDLIILDIMMPGMNGFDVTQAIRQDEDTEDIPIIIFTAKSDMEDKVHGLELGAEAYLTKPISTRELLAHVKAVIARSSKTRPPEVSPAEKGAVIAILAPRGGMGVSTIAINLGVCLEKTSHQDVLVSDFRPGQGILGLESGHSTSEGFNRLLELQPKELTSRRIEQEMVVHSSGLRMLLSSSRPADGKYLSRVENFSAIARLLPRLATYVVLDLGSGLNPMHEKVLPYCNRVLVLVEPIPVSVTQAANMLIDLRTLGVGESQIDAIMVNRLRSSIQLTITEVENQLGRSLLVSFPPNPELAYQVSIQSVPMTLLQPEGLIAQQFEQLAAKVAQRRT